MKRDLTEDQLRQEVTVALPLSVLLRINDQPSNPILPAGAAPSHGRTLVIGSEFEGGIYAGVTIHEEEPHRLVLLPGEAEKLTHAEALQWAIDQGGYLPSRFDGLVLLKNLKDRFREAYYWLEPQPADGAGFAWSQFFGYGHQYWNGVSYRYRARAVRRIPIR